MNILLIRRFGLPLVLMTAAAVLLAGCNDSSPTEPKVLTATPSTSTPTPSPTPLPPSGSVAGAWIGTYHGVSFTCDTSAQASFEQTGGAVLGTLTATGSCGDVWHFSGALQGNTLAGSITDYDTLVVVAHGILSGSTLEITIDNGSGLTVAQAHLHR
jgi:hypothetical protein